MSWPWIRRELDRIQVSSIPAVGHARAREVEDLQLQGRCLLGLEIGFERIEPAVRKADHAGQGLAPGPGLGRCLEPREGGAFCQEDCRSIQIPSPPHCDKFTVRPGQAWTFDRFVEAYKNS